jgi:hypothetical protein
VKIRKRHILPLAILLSAFACWLVIAISSWLMNAPGDNVARIPQAKPIDPYLLADGHLNLSSNWESSARVRGYLMQTDVGSGPTFQLYTDATNTLKSGHYVYAAVYREDRLYVGGFLTSLLNDDGTFLSNVNHIVYWRSGHWHALGRGLNGPVYAMAFAGEDLYIGGDFRWAFNADGTAIQVNHIARWDGQSWHALHSGFDGPVEAIQIVQGKLYASGSFSRTYSQGPLAQLHWGLTTLNPIANPIFRSIQQTLTSCNRAPIGAASWVSVIRFAWPGLNASKQKSSNLPRLARLDPSGWTLVGLQQSPSGACGTSYEGPPPTPTLWIYYFPIISKN